MKSQWQHVTIEFDVCRCDAGYDAIKETKNAEKNIKNIPLGKVHYIFINQMFP